MIDGEKTPRAVSATACARGKVRPTQQGERRLGCVTEGTAGKPPAPARARESEAAKYAIIAFAQTRASTTFGGDPP